MTGVSRFLRMTEMEQGRPSGIGNKERTTKRGSDLVFLVCSYLLYKRGCLDCESGCCHRGEDKHFAGAGQSIAFHIASLGVGLRRLNYCLSSFPSPFAIRLQACYGYVDSVDPWSRGVVEPLDHR